MVGPASFRILEASEDAEAARPVVHVEARQTSCGLTLWLLLTLALWALWFAARGFPWHGAETSDLISETLVCGESLPMTGKIAIIGTQKHDKQELQSPLPWVNAEGLRKGGFARWTVDSGKCWVVPQGSDQLVIQECATSFTGFVFKEVAEQPKLGGLENLTDEDEATNASSNASWDLQEPPVEPQPRGAWKQPRYVPPPVAAQHAAAWARKEASYQISLMHYPDRCLTAKNGLYMAPCSKEPLLASTAGRRLQAESQVFVLQRLSFCDGKDTAYLVRMGDKCLALADGSLVLGACENAMWIKVDPLINEQEIQLNVNPVVINNLDMSLGETYMGNPGVHLPWDVKHLVDFGWAGDHCAAPDPDYSDPGQACHELEISGKTKVQCPLVEALESTLLGDGKGCRGLCDMASQTELCSCGTMMCPSCRFGEGYTAMSDTSFLPEGCIFVGCTQGADPARPEGSYYPFLIPGGLNIRTCPSNVLDGRTPWTKTAAQTASMCAFDAACDGEKFVGKMWLSGRSFSFCCPGETEDPFSALSLGYYGLMPERGHYGAPGAQCNSTGCLYRPSCACPWSITSFNIRVTGPSTSLGSVFIKHPSTVQVAPQDHRLVVAPDMDGSSTWRLYATAIGSDDSFHVGDGVKLNPPGIAKFLQSCNYPCEQRYQCPAITLPPYPGFGGPTEINPSGEWNVKAPDGPSLYDKKRVLITPTLRGSRLSMGPVFVGHPGKTYVGKDPDLRGIFQGLEHRPTTGPGSSPGGTTSIGTEWLKAFFQCKESVVSGTEFDPRIWY